MLSTRCLQYPDSVLAASALRLFLLSDCETEEMTGTSFIVINLTWAELSAGYATEQLQPCIDWMTPFALVVSKHLSTEIAEFDTV